jgi:acyl carrier protein
MNRHDALVMFNDLVEASPGTIGEEVALRDVPGWDSLAIVGFLAKADELFEIRVPPARAIGCATVGQLIDLLVEKRAA